MVNTDSIKLNNLSIGIYLISATLSYTKLWSGDSGKNMAGSNTGTVIGIFPKLDLVFRRTTGDEVALLLTELNKTSITVTYYDLESKTSKTMSCFASDIGVPIKMLNGYESFTATVTANSKRV